MFLKTEPEKSAGRIIRDVRKELPQVITDNLPSTHSMKNTVNKARVQIIGGPANPDTLEELGDIPDHFKHILTRDSVGNDTGNELFLAADIGEGADRILIFGRKEAFRMLRRADRWFVDGTFKVRLIRF